ncbi:MAG: hypothetical protein ACYSWO_23450 [Planctomycetota bacterium]
MFLLLSNYATSTVWPQICASRGVAHGATKLYEDGAAGPLAPLRPRAIDLSQQDADAFVRTYPVTRRL